MPQRVVNVVEKHIRPVPAFPILATAATSTDILEDCTNDKKEHAARYIFNDSGTVAFYAFGQDCSPLSYHGKLQNQQQLDCSNHSARVSIYSAAGGVFVPCDLLRVDLDVGPFVFPQ